MTNIQTKQDNNRAVILIDSDDFYGLTLDLVLFNFNLPAAVKVQSVARLESWQKELEKAPLKGAIYIIDEYFGTGKIDQVKLINDIKALDKEATFICYTVSNPEELENRNLFEYVVLKSGKSNEQSLIKILSDIMGLEFIADNSDPELEFNQK